MTGKKWFSFDWLVSKERRELKKLLEEKEVRDRIEQLQQERKPYRNLVYSGNMVTVILRDGTTLSQYGVTPEQVNYLRKAETEWEINNILYPLKDAYDNLDDRVEKELISFNVDDRVEKELISFNVDALVNFGDFIVSEDGHIIMRGINMPLPHAVAASFIEILEKLEYYDDLEEEDEFFQSFEEDILAGTQEEYDRLKLFWMKLATNPLEQSRAAILTFCRNNDIRISRTGNIIAYRRADKMQEELYPLEQFAVDTLKKMEEWDITPAIDPSEFNVFQKPDASFTVRRKDTAYQVEDIVIAGSLLELYNQATAPKEVWYTSNHNPGKYKFQVGDIYQIDESEIELDNGICHGGGLHFASVDYDYSSYGDTPFVVLVNPSRVTTVPHSETAKGRTVEMKIALINPNERGEHIDETLIEQADREYTELHIRQIEAALESMEYSPLNILDNNPEVGETDLVFIKDQLKNRVQQVA